MRDQFGLVPTTIKANYEREEMVDRQMTAAFALHRALVALDDRLDLVFISEGGDKEYGVTPGRWHVVRKNPPPAPDSYMAITTEDGGYREPDSGVLTELQRRDLWKHGIPEHDPKPQSLDDGRVEELAHALRAGARVAGDGGIFKRRWARG